MNGKVDKYLEYEFETVEKILGSQLDKEVSWCDIIGFARFWQYEHFYETKDKILKKGNPEYLGFELVKILKYFELFQNIHHAIPECCSNHLYAFRYLKRTYNVVH